MAEQISGGSSPEQYQASLTDWRGLVVLSPAQPEEAYEHGAALRQALGSYGDGLLGPAVEVDQVSGNLLITFNLADSESGPAIYAGIAGVCQAVGASQIGEPEFVAMQLARELDLQIFGDEVLGGDEHYVGQQAYDIFRQFSNA